MSAPGPGGASAGGAVGGTNTGGTGGTDIGGSSAGVSGQAGTDIAGGSAGEGPSSAGAAGTNTGGDGLGPCSGTPDECGAAREFNAYRTTHFQQGECNNPLVWHETLGTFAHDWALQTFDEQEHSFGPYGESLGYGDDGGVHDMVFFISEYDPPGEDHCAPDGSFVASHHCNTMRCDAFTIGVGVVREAGKLYLVVEFGGMDGSSI